jgi:hypothetical protein
MSWLAAVLASDPAAAAVPPIQSVRVAHPYVPANTMMFQVTVRVRDHAADADHVATVGFAPSGTDCATGTWRTAPAQQFDTVNARTWILYDFLPGAAYDYKVQVGSGATARTQCGALGSPRLPANLQALNFQYAKGSYDTRYVVLDVEDCGTGTGRSAAREYLVAVDTDAETVVWYLDVASRSSLGGVENKGWRLQSDRFLVVMDKRYLYEWAWDGTILSAKDLAAGGECDDSDSYGPCVNHDAYRSDATGETFVITTRQSTASLAGTPWESCTGSLFVDDGFTVLDDDANVIDQRFLMTDYGYDPTLDGGPHVGTPVEIGCANMTWKPYFDPYDSIDWTHLNSISGSSFGGDEVLDLSVKEFDQIVRLDAAGDVLWTLASDPAYSDWGTIRRATGVFGPPRFSSQHDVHAVSADEILMFDNVGDRSGGRAIRIALDDGPPATATMVASWAVVDAAGTRLGCDLQGSARELPGTDRVLATCSDAYTVVELDDPTGAETVPALALWLDDTTSGASRFCTSGGPTSLDALHGFYRAVPVGAIGGP